MVVGQLTASATRLIGVRRRRRLSSAVAFWTFMAPLALGLLVFKYIAILWGLLLSFSNARGTVALGNWVGLENYQTLLESPAFRAALVTIGLFTLFIVPTTFAISLGLALLVNRVPRGGAFFRTVFFVPGAVSYVTASLIWKTAIFNGLPSGLANALIGNFGAEPVFWIGTARPPWFWLVLVTVRLWLQAGFYMIIFLAGLKEIPQELYEAAHVDGARTGLATFRHITFPLLRNTSVAVLLLLLIAAFQAFDEFYNILGGGAQAQSGNNILARPPLVYLYAVAQGQQNYGLGSAGAFVLALLIILVTLVQGRAFGFGRAAD
jgi:multiple sugar transport system permease protein